MGLFGNWPATGDANAPSRSHRDETRLLFVCTGNIARSASADLIARQRYGALGLRYESAGVGALDGHGIAADVAPALAARSIDAAPHAGRQLTSAIARDAGLIVALDRGHRRWILEEWPDLVPRVALLGEAGDIARRARAGRAGGLASLPPTGAAVGRRSRDDLPLAEWIVRQCTHDARFDIADPYRRGAEAGETAVAQIDLALASLLPWYAGHLAEQHGPAAEDAGDASS